MVKISALNPQEFVSPFQLAANLSSVYARLGEKPPERKTYRDNLLVRSPRFRVGVDIQILREGNRPFSKLVLRLNINRPGSEALNQIISERGHLPSPDPLDTNCAQAHQHCRLDSLIDGNMGTRKCRFAL